MAGTYATSINIHNPQTHDLTFCKKIVIDRQEGACPPPLGSPPCPKPVIVEDTLRPDFAERVDCPLIQRLAPDRDHVDGFVVIEVPSPLSDVGPPQAVLDVVGKYTARSFFQPPTEVSALDIVVYQPQKILRNQ